MKQRGTAYAETNLTCAEYLEENLKSKVNPDIMHLQEGI